MRLGEWDGWSASPQDVHEMGLDANSASGHEDGKLSRFDRVVSTALRGNLIPESLARLDNNGLRSIHTSLRSFSPPATFTVVRRSIGNFDSYS